MNALVVQCGGPTAVINASLAAVIEGWQRSGGRLYGARMGTQGLAQGDFVELPSLSPPEIERLARQPAAALGSGRFSLTDDAIASAVRWLDAAQIGALFLIGGNGTMGAAQRLAAAASHVRVLGIPKTVDNDLLGTDVAPGYGSVARYTAASVRNALLDLRAMSNFDQVVVLETMGRHTGWIAASAALARAGPGDGPHLLLLPEMALDEDRILARITEVKRTQGYCVVVAAEGARDSSGAFLAEKMGDGGTDDRGQPVLSMASGVAAYLARRVQNEIGLRCRQIRPNTLQRSSDALASPVDRELARRAGAAAVEFARQGATGIMVGLQRIGDAAWLPVPVPLHEVAGREHPVPDAMLDAAGYDVTAVYLEYARPLVGDLEPPPLLWC